MAALLQILVPKINDSYRHTVTYRRLALPKNRANDCTPAPHPLHPAAWPKRHQPFPRGSRFFFLHEGCISAKNGLPLQPKIWCCERHAVMCRRLKGNQVRILSRPAAVYPEPSCHASHCVTVHACGWEGRVTMG